ncbi:hypothetical protein BDZ89DRAFT_1075231 [Hymenopellis radicata]|nr:hypothetical protein BDZ89DRAFT_1075231 [Hymenopellis radicata]
MDHPMSSSRLSSATLPAYTRNEVVLPSYTCLYPMPSAAFDFAPSTVHSFPISKKAQTNWATLTLMSHAKSPSSVPLLYAGNVLKGSVNLSLSEPKTIRGISVTLRGLILLSTKEPVQHVFLEETLCTRETPAKKSKAYGQLECPFETTFPATAAAAATTDPTRQYPLPEFFYETNSSVQLVYELLTCIKRGRFQSDVELCTKILFIPRHTALEFSDLRQRAYIEGLPAPGPDSDPNGWLGIPIQFPGKSQDKGDIMVTGMVHLDKPLVYPRGSVILCHIELRNTCSELDAKDVLDIELRRTITFLDPTNRHKKATATRETFTTDISTIQWDSSYRRGKGIFRGELHVHYQLPASSAYPLFKVEYMVAISAKKSSSFTPLGGSESLATRDVAVATEFAPFSLPTSYTRAPPLKWLEGPDPLAKFSLSDQSVLCNHGMSVGMIPPLEGNRALEGYSGGTNRKRGHC